MNLLVVEDDEVFARALCADLEGCGHEVTHVTRARAASVAIVQQAFDVLVLDRALPDGDGIVHLAQWRERGVRLPVILLTGLAATDQKIDGLDAGADDYLTKPVDVGELDARLRALARRTANGAETTTILEVGRIRIDRLRREAWRDGKRLRLQPRELRMLEELALARGEIVTRRALLKSIWGFDFDPRTKLIETHMSRLRDKLGEVGRAAPIETIRGGGYRLRTDE